MPVSGSIRAACARRALLAIRLSWISRLFWRGPGPSIPALPSSGFQSSILNGVIARFVHRITPRAGKTLLNSCKPLSYLRLPGCAMQSRIHSQMCQRSNEGAHGLAVGGWGIETFFETDQVDTACLGAFDGFRRLAQRAVRTG